MFPSGDVDPSATYSLRFSEPVDPETIDAFGNLELGRGAAGTLGGTNESIVMLQDVTDLRVLRDSREALSQSEGQFRAIFDKSPDVILVVDTQTGKLLKANQAAEQILGRSRDDLLQQPFVALFPHDSSISVEDLVSTIKSSGPILESRQYLKSDASVSPMAIPVSRVG